MIQTFLHYYSRPFDREAINESKRNEKMASAGNGIRHALLHPVLLVLSREWSGLQMLYARNLARENFCLVKWPRASGCTLFMVCKTK